MWWSSDDGHLAVASLHVVSAGGCTGSEIPAMRFPANHAETFQCICNTFAGEVRPDCPVALIENKSDGETDTMKVIPCEHQLPQQREQVRYFCLRIHVSPEDRL